MSETVINMNINTAANSGIGNFLEAKNVEVTGLKIETSQVNIHPSEKLNWDKESIWFDVKEPVELFTGRKEELENLHREVQRNSGNNALELTVISQMTSISGLGGVGKSELAKKYIREHRHDYDGNVIWINAEKYETLSESFRRLANDTLKIATKGIDGQQKDIKSIVTEVYKYFAKRKCLFIFDNAEKFRTEKEGDEGIDKFLPNNLPPDDNKPYIIITSRNQKWEKRIKVIPLDTFTEEEAIKLIKKGLNINDDSQQNEVIQLSQTLQRFPLALQQAVAYIKDKDEALKNLGEEKNFGINHYLEIYEKKAREVLNFPFQEESSNPYFKTTFITWEVTLEKIQHKKHGQQALGVLKIIAYFAPDNIPINIFLQLVKDGELELGSILQLPKQYSMVGLEKGVLNIHRLVQQVMQLGIIEEQKEKETLRKALKLLKNTAEEASSKSIKCIPHATSVWNYASIHRELIEEFSQFPSRFIVHLRDAGRYEEACKFAVKTIQLLKDKLGQKDPSTLMTQHIMATVLRSQGQYDEAFKLNQEVYEIRKAILGHDHQDTLTSLHNMASILVKQGRYDEALKFYQEVYEKQKEIIGPDHPDTLTSQYSIIVTQLNQGHGEVLLSSFQELSEKLKEILNDDDKSSELYQVVYEKQKDLIEPIRVIPHNIIIQSKDKILGTYSISYEILKKIHGPDNLHTLKVQHCIAKLLHHQGKYEEAIKEYQEVYKKLKEVLGPVNPDTLMIQYDITSVQHHQGKYEKAIKGYQEVYEKLKAVLEPVHPNTIQVQYSMALALDKQGQYEEAYKHYQEVHEKQKEVLGPDHRDTLLTWSNLKKFMEKCPNF